MASKSGQGMERRRHLASVILHENKVIADAGVIRTLTKDHFATVLATDAAIADYKAVQDQILSSPTFANNNAAPFDSVLQAVDEITVRNAILRTDAAKAAGLDEVEIEHLQAGVEVLAQPLADLFSSILHTSHWPQCWKSGLICPIPKGLLDPRVLANTRPITLTPVLSRIMAAILADRLQQVATRVLHPAQAGFQPGHSTLEHLLTMRLALEASRLNHQPIHPILLDIRRAYDTVPWSVVDACMQRLHVPEALRALMLNMMRGNTLQVRSAGGVTEPFEQKRGVLQGSPLSCALFCIFMDALLCLLGTLPGFQVTARCSVNVLGYADDIAFLAPSHRVAAKAARMADRFLRRCDMELSVTKCIYAPSLRTRPIRLSGDRQIECLLPHLGWKYLGVTFSTALNWEPQRTAMLADMQKVKFTIQRCALTGAQAAYYMNAVVFPRFAYKLCIGCASPTIIKTVQRAAEAALRGASRLPHALCSAALRAPVEHGGLGLQDLQHVSDVALVTNARALLMASDSVPGCLFRDALLAWQARLNIPVQPYHRLSFIPVRVHGHCEMCKQLCIGVAGALQRLRIDGLVVADWPQVYGRVPLCCVLPQEVVCEIHEELQRWHLTFVDELIRNNTLISYATLVEERALHRYNSQRTPPNWWQQLCEALRITIAADEVQQRVCTTLQQMNEAVNIFTATHYSQGLERLTNGVIYTDGSSVTDPDGATAGGSFVFELPNASTAEPGEIALWFRTAGNNSSFKSELLAILHALIRAKAVNAICIRSDSQACLALIDHRVRALISDSAAVSNLHSNMGAAKHLLRQSEAELIAAVATAIAKRREAGQSTTLEWTRGHCGTTGNECADRLANLGRGLRADPRALTAATPEVNTALIVDECRLEGPLAKYAQKLASLRALRERAALREQGQQHQPERQHHDAARDPLTSIAAEIACYPQLPEPLTVSSSVAWRGWRRKLLAVLHGAMPTAAWLFRTGHATQPGCMRCDQSLLDTTQHALTSCAMLRNLRKKLVMESKLRMQQLTGLLRHEQLDSLINILQHPWIPFAQLQNKAARLISQQPPVIQFQLRSAIADCCAAVIEFIRQIWAAVKASTTVRPSHQ